MMPVVDPPVAGDLAELDPLGPQGKGRIKAESQKQARPVRNHLAGKPSIFRLG